jgi:hypothetical protein
VPVEVGVPLREGVALLVGVGTDDAPELPVADAVGVREGVLVGVIVGVPTIVAEGERLPVRVLVGEPLAIGVVAAEGGNEPEGVRVGVGVPEGDAPSTNT